jgi:hypothetical protein
MDTIIKEKIKELEILGKEKSELEIWESLLPNMTDEEKQDLIKSLEEEIALIKAN